LADVRAVVVADHSAPNPVREPAGSVRPPITGSCSALNFSQLSVRGPVGRSARLPISPSLRTRGPAGGTAHPFSSPEVDRVPGDGRAPTEARPPRLQPVTTHEDDIEQYGDRADQQEPDHEP
jgi:hypothetical protein